MSHDFGYHRLIESGLVLENFQQKNSENMTLYGVYCVQLVYKENLLNSAHIASILRSRKKIKAIVAQSYSLSEWLADVPYRRTSMEISRPTILSNQIKLPVSYVKLLAISPPQPSNSVIRYSR